MRAFVVDGHGQVDSLLEDGTEADGIPACTIYDERGAEELLTSFGFEGAALGRYEFWMSSTSDDGRVGISWIRSTRSNRRACEESLLLTGWKKGEWYRWSVDFRPLSMTDTCGVTASAVEGARRPATFGERR